MSDISYHMTEARNSLAALEDSLSQLPDLDDIESTLGELDTGLDTLASEIRDLRYTDVNNLAEEVDRLADFAESLQGEANNAYTRLYT